MEKLQEELDRLIATLPNADDLHARLETLVSVYPFNDYEYIIATLLAADKLTHDEYVELRDAYIARNMFLYVFEISAPRGFGDTWAFGHLSSLVPELKRPVKAMDPSYRGEYDFYLGDEDGGMIKVEVKASRAVDRTKPDEPLYVKALASDSKKPFLMNYQQLKPSCCDVFLWIAVYRDAIRYWVLSSDAVRKHKDFTPQHRNRETSARQVGYKSEDIFEGQIMITNENVESIDKYRVTAGDLKKAIVAARYIRK